MEARIFLDLMKTTISFLRDGANTSNRLRRPMRIVHPVN